MSDQVNEDKNSGCEAVSSPVSPERGLMYNVASGTYIAELINGVEEMAADGYVPVGGIAVLHQQWANERKGYEETETWFYQAMVKRNAPADKGIQ